MVKARYVAEIGLNHNGSVDLAKKHIELAKESGADYAKFQCYLTDQRAKPGSSIKGILRHCELNKDQMAELKEFCDIHKIGFASTAFCVNSTELLREIGCDLIKIASFQLGNQELIYTLSKSEWVKELWISTGMATTSEILDAHKILTNNDSFLGDRFCFLHCVSQYPVEKFCDYKLINIPWLAKITGRSAGYSDHTMGADSAVLAVCLGASLIEKHFTIDNDLEGADHAMSANPDIFSELVNRCKDAEEMIGVSTRDGTYSCESGCLQFKD